MKNANASQVRQGQYAHALRQSFRSLLLAFQAGICLHASGFACQVDMRPLSQLPFEFQVFSPQPGQVVIQLLAGEADLPVNNLMGFDLQFDLNAGLQPGASASFRPMSAWSTADDLFTAGISMDPSTGAISLSFRRTDCQSVSGYGLLGEILIDGIQDISNGDELVRLTAGLVLEEVVNGAKQASALTSGGIPELPDSDVNRPHPSQDEIQVWPQPASGFLHWSLPDGVETTDVYLMDLHGRTLQHQQGDNTTIDIGALPSGVYFLRCRRRDGYEYSRRICKS